MTKPIRGGTLVLTAIIASAVLSLPVLNWRPVAAAEVFGRSFQYGVFINNRRVQVGNTPIAVGAGQTVRIQGWVVDGDTGNPGMSLLCGIDGAVPTPVGGYPLARPDVAAAEHDRGAGKSGFELPIDTSKLSSGVHRYRFILVGQSGSQTALSPDVQISVGGR
jgi:hypothetical protein